MAFSEPWCVGVCRSEMYDAVVTDELERAVWKGVEDGRIASETSREQYDAMGEEDRAKFLAKMAVAMRMTGSLESTGERIAVYEAYPQSEES